MRKYVLCFLFLAIATAAMAQKKSIVNLIQSERSTGTKVNGRQLIKVYKGVFKQDYSLLRSDSAYFYPNENAFDAFGNVNINQGDTLNIFSDKLNYNGNTKTAILTDNVKMVDRDATLTTNYLTYNTASRIGTYTGGGKLVNKDNVLTSKNGYYFAFSRDSYFRYDVVLTTPDALIKNDTLKYNTGTRIAYFFGPTNIYGTKDKDTLYTENGLYNTVTEQAYFGKKNSYRQGTKSLKGDSLFYDKLKGYGRAVKNITFEDREQKVTIKGDLGTYFRAEEKTVVTENAYVVLISEQKDTSKTDTTVKQLPVANKNAKASAKNITDLTKIAGAIKPDSSHKAPANTMPIKQPFAIGKKDSANVDMATKLVQGALQNNKDANADALIKAATQAKKGNEKLIDSALKAAAPALKNNKDKVGIKNIGSLAGVADAIKPGVAKVTGKLIPVKAAVKDTGHIKRDSIYMTADTIETQIMTYKNQKIYQERQRTLRDTTLKQRKVAADKKSSKFLTAYYIKVPKDTSYFHRDFFGKPKPVNDSLQRKKDALAAIKKAKQDSIAREQMQRDPVFKQYPVNLKDTARVRMLIGHHHVKIFKSDLQAKSDSVFYSNSDSTMRMYVNPIIWTQGSQLSGDTVYMQMRHKKLDNIELFPSAFIVNIEKDDSTHFNQVSGKKMRGYFKDDKLDQMYTFGNAETIYFQRDSGKVSGMQRSLSSRIRTVFKKNQATDIYFLTKPENRYIPIEKVKEDDKILKGFLWKPKERPASKEDIIKKRSRKVPATKSPAKNAPAKPGSAKPGVSLKTDSLKGPGIKNMQDSTLKVDTGKNNAIKFKKDTINRNFAPKLPGNGQKKDSIVNKTPSVKKN
ncbi:OstA-like protein [Mucilaginibacter gossypiicola]|uniref:OstA-like protein n=2 Tax=Mucilaginibacter gossypiicola TaxID=551995 RepID=A0A1H8QMW2_9SPHI|nr:OstA-like protein [Mucilaginibacter gossypiicola]